MVMTDLEQRLLTTSDRCDSCGAQAYYAVELKTGELFFCRHHFSKNEDTLINIAIDIYDESDALTEPKRSALDTE
jgi:hypothetical protein